MIPEATREVSMSNDTDLFEDFKDFEETLEEGDSNESIRNKDIDYVKYIEALSQHATNRLVLPTGSYVDLKPVYLHGTKIHSLIFNVNHQGKRYSARLIRRVSLGLRDRESDRWLNLLKEAYDVAMSLPPVGLDPQLETIPYWKESNRNKLRMTFQKGDSTLVLSASKVVEASGDKDDLIVILQSLKDRGVR